jgi:peptidoglycan-associated lipoprotein
MKKTSILLLIFMFAVGLFLMGCPPKKVATEVETPGEEAAVQPEAVEEKGEIQVAKEEIKAEEVTRRGATPPFGDVRFDFDKYNIKDDYRSVLMDVSDWMLGTNSSILVEGHCDERGTNEYNLALGDRRASSVKNFLAASGISPSKIETISFGEEKPLCNQADEPCWARNRRAHFVTQGGN